ncbi:hypothetical protein PP175_26525 (plasmid) [Aneurinibacillus sp. Ricciae_BoGa-3]|uniref:DNA ligase LigA-related protein n=1 Tax=Aneurinibacillus sp. Ricciae_BoGa-3 TaxID=3022697 RepID=UPI0023408E58|nr:hypothetical protein [Aneurinibacillus sp. Ricciae_BoGa-3]WCK57621.1 hypothetical protein PP175_26525 [Aneurinibacillus sp. Ricciae_BoGa-3]
MANEIVLDKDSAKQRIAFLQEEVTKHDKLYEMNNPIITDTEYDKLYRELVQLELANPEFITPESPTQRIVAVMVDGLKKGNTLDSDVVSGKSSHRRRNCEIQQKSQQPYYRSTKTGWTYHCSYLR